MNWVTTETECDLIGRVGDRAADLFGEALRQADVEMDITACHLNGCALDLPKLLAADDFNFMHDIHGIGGNLDRTTGQLLDCFLPRCAA